MAVQGQACAPKQRGSHKTVMKYVGPLFLVVASSLGLDFLESSLLRIPFLPKLVRAVSVVTKDSGKYNSYLIMSYFKFPAEKP